MKNKERKEAAKESESENTGTEFLVVLLVVSGIMLFKFYDQHHVEIIAWMLFGKLVIPKIILQFIGLCLIFFPFVKFSLNYLESQYKKFMEKRK